MNAPIALELVGAEGYRGKRVESASSNVRQNVGRAIGARACRASNLGRTRSPERPSSKGIPYPTGG